MRTILLTILTFSLNLFPLLSFADDRPPTSPEKVGVILPLTGEAASLGTAIKNGMVMAYEKLPAESKAKFVLQFEDDALQAKNSVTAFNKLVSIDKIKALVNVSSGTGKALRPLAEQRKIPFIAIASDPKVSAGAQYTFNLWVTPEAEAKELIPEVQKRGYKRIARISTVHEGAFALRSAFDIENKKSVEVVLDEEYPSEIKDFRPFINKLRAAGNVDAVLVVLLPGQCGLFAKQMREAGLKQPMFSFEMFEDKNEVEVAGGALVGAWYVNASDPNKTFFEEYYNRYPNASVWAAANGYDAVMLISKSLEQGGLEDLHTLLKDLKDFSGELGTYSASGDNRFTLPASIKEVTKEGFKTVNG